MSGCEDDIFCGVNKSDTTNVDQMNDLEKKHTPVIEAPDSVKPEKEFKVKIKLGEYMDHPNEHNHFIQWVELFSGDTFLGRQEFASERAEPEANFKLKLDHVHDLRAVAHCNLHGSWEGKKKLDKK